MKQEIINKKQTMKKRHIIYALLLVINFIWNVTEVGRVVDLLLWLRIAGNAALLYTLMEIFAAVFKGPAIKNDQPLMVAYIIWGATNLLAIFLEWGTLLKVVTIFPVISLLIGVFSLMGILKSKRAEEMTTDEIFSFGFWWIGGVLLIPVILILVLLGY